MMKMMILMMMMIMMILFQNLRDSCSSRESHKSSSQLSRRSSHDAVMAEDRVTAQAHHEDRVTAQAHQPPTSLKKYLHARTPSGRGEYSAENSEEKLEFRAEKKM